MTPTRIAPKIQNNIKLKWHDIVLKHTREKSHVTGPLIVSLKNTFITEYPKIYYYYLSEFLIFNK